MSKLIFIDEPIYIHSSQPLRIGTDCSGIDAPIKALEQLCIPHRHVWSSDIDKYCIKSIKANYCPERIYGDSDGQYPDGDIRNRDNNILPDIDLYVCGFPCQPFSTAGTRQGFKDKRGNVFWSCIDVIRIKKPAYFILENVYGLLNHDKGNTWKVIWNEVKSLEDIGYKVQWKILNTRHYGIPQNRERVYIVGTKKLFKWPEKIEEINDINNYVEWDIKDQDIIPPYAKNFVEQIENNIIFVNLSYRKFNHKNGDKYSHCITASCARKIWLKPLSRYATCKELLLLQGFTSFRQVVSDNILKHQIGNSMSVNIIKCLLKNLNILQTQDCLTHTG